MRKGTSLLVACDSSPEELKQMGYSGNANGGNIRKFLIAFAITLSVILLKQISTNNDFNNNNKNITEAILRKQQFTNYQFHNQHINDRKLRIKKNWNSDASLMAPYLDKLNKFWHVSGSTEIRNHKGVKLTTLYKPHTYGTIISNGIGDNTINDFETTFKFNVLKAKDQIPGDGFSFIISSENEFALRDLRSSFALRQYLITSKGVMGQDTSMMGFPKNLPGLAIVIDTYANLEENVEKVPFANIYVNFNPQRAAYDLKSDGLRSSSRQLNKNAIPLKKEIMEGIDTEIRVIYLESISFLKIEIRYSNYNNKDLENEGWIELFHNDGSNILIPKDHVTGQRYIGMGALTGELTESVELISVKTYEFHWNNGNEKMEDTFEYAKEAVELIKREYQTHIELEENSFKKWKMVKHKELDDNMSNTFDNLQLNTPSRWITMRRIFLIIVVLPMIIIMLYFFTLYIRVAKKHFKKIRKRRHSDNFTANGKYHDYALPI